MINRIDDISVSISMITYNHEKYIEEAIESILMQNVDFKFEIVIGDDCSPDNTQMIIQKYANQYPDLIKPILRNENIGTLKNLDDINKRCRGKYIIILEGDDYWTDSNKLQSQFEFLEANSEYVAVASWCEVVDENGNISDEITNKYDVFNFNKNIYSLEDYQRGKIPGHMNTILFRNMYLNADYDYYKLYSAHAVVGDRTLYLILVLLGDIYVNQKVMSCYRFFRKNGSTNYSSTTIGKNESLIYFVYYSNLEKYVYEIMGKQISLRNLKYSFLANSIIRAINEPNEENKCIRNEIIHGFSKFEIILFIPSIFIKKLNSKLSSFKFIKKMLFM